MWWMNLRGKIVIAIAKLLGIKAIVWNVAFYNCTAYRCSSGNYPSGKPVEIRGD